MLACNLGHVTCDTCSEPRREGSARGRRRWRTDEGLHQNNALRKASSVNTGEKALFNTHTHVHTLTHTHTHTVTILPQPRLQMLL